MSASTSANMRRTTRPLALQGFAAHDGTRGAGGRDGSIAGIVVVDVDVRTGQRGAEVRNDLGDGGLLVVARHQDGDPLVRQGIGIHLLLHESLNLFHEGLHRRYHRSFPSNGCRGRCRRMIAQIC